MISIDESLPLEFRIKKAKVILYRFLLEKHEGTFTDIEIDLMYSLAKDKDIQEILSAGGATPYVKR